MKSFLRVLFELALIAAVVFLGNQLYQKQGLPWGTTVNPLTSEADTQTLEALQKLAVDFGATNSDSLTGKNALDLISDIQIKLGSAQTCSCSSLDDTEFEVLDDLLGVKDQATLAKIKKQDAFVKPCSGAKVLILKKE